MQLTLDELKNLFHGEGKLDHRRKNLVGIRCPQCGGEEFGISIDKWHRFGCYRKQQCGYSGNIFTLLRFLGKHVSEIKPGFEPRARLENKLFFEELSELNLDLQDMSMPTGWKRTFHTDYLQSRGFSDEDYKRFEVGQTKIDPRFQGWTIFAVRQFGNIKGYVARNPKSKEELDRINRIRKKNGKKPELRYQNSPSDFAKMLYGMEEFTENTNTAILVEGIFDKHNTDKQLQLPDQDEVKCCCTFKCGVSAEQIFLLQECGITTIILMYDPDVIKEIKKAALKLDEYFNVYVGFNEDGRDPGDMSQDCFEKVLSELKTPSQFNVSKLDVPELKKK